MTQPAHIWIVSGETGSYEDRGEWTVAAFTSREEADALCKRLNDWCRENDVHSISRTFRGDEYNERGRRIAEIERTNTSPDPFFQCRDDTTYTVSACALGDVHRDCAVCRGER